LQVGAIEWGVEWEAAKYEASRRVVPCVPPLLAMLKCAYLEQGRPQDAARVCPPRHRAESGLMSSGGLAKRAERRWRMKGLQPISLQECRHTAATWLDAAGVSPKVASILMGQAVPERQAGAAAITLARYTHALPDDVERARQQLTAYLQGGGAEARAR
jgi:integrase